MERDSSINLDSVVIRKFRQEDVEPLLEAVLESLPELSAWMPWCHVDYGRDDARRWVESREEAWNAQTELSFVIDDGRGGLLGTCGLNRFDLPNRTANLGYWVRTSATRQGVASKAARLLVDLAFETTSLQRIEIMASEANHASQQVAIKIGAVREAVVRRRLWCHEAPHDAILFAVLRP